MLVINLGIKEAKEVGKCDRCKKPTNMVKVEDVK
jgi:hypothetical protein